MAADRHSSGGGRGRRGDVQAGQGDLPPGAGAAAARLRDDLRARIRAIEAGRSARAASGEHASTRPVASSDEFVADGLVAGELVAGQLVADESARSADAASAPGDPAGPSAARAHRPAPRTAQSAPPRAGAAGRDAGVPVRPRPQPSPFADPEPARFDDDACGGLRSAAGPSGLDSAADGKPDPGSDLSAGDASFVGLFDDPPPQRERRRGGREQSPTQRALGLLTRREHSRKELSRKLKSRGLDAGEVDEAVDRLAEAGWQNDERFAESLVRSRAGNGYGPLHIRAELATHGLPAEAIAAALAAYEGDWLENARDLVRRRFGEAHWADPRLRRKAADLLLRRGFDGETARNANRSRDPD